MFQHIERLHKVMLRTSSIVLLSLLALPSHAVDIIVDTTDPGETNSSSPPASPLIGWHAQSLASAYRGATLRSYNLNAWSKYVFGTLSGQYDIYVYWPVRSSTLADGSVPVTVKHSTGTQVVSVNQQINGGQWNLIGRWTLDSTEFVTLTNDSGPNTPIYSDAVKLVPFIPPPSPPPPPPPPPPPVTGIIHGIGVQSHMGSFDAAGKAFVLELGAHAVRLGWHGDTAPALANINWADANGVEVLFVLGYSGACGTMSTAAGRQCYADRSATLATSYGTKVKYYEVWNEWNGGIGLGCVWNQAGSLCIDAATYKDLLCRTYTAVKAAIPGALIVGGVTAGTDTAFVSRMLDAGAGPCMDVVSVHPYPYVLGRVTPTTAASVAVDRFASELRGLNTMIISKLGTAKPIIVSEEGRSDGGQAVSQPLTAAYVTELYRRAPSMPNLIGIWWFALEDTADGPYGLLRSNNTKKPAFGAYQAAIPMP